MFTLSIKAKIFVIAFASCLSALSIAVLSGIGLTHLNDAIHFLNDEAAPAVAERHDALLMLEELNGTLYQYSVWKLLNGPTEDLEGFGGTIETRLATLSTLSGRGILTGKALDEYKSRIEAAYYMVQRDPRLGFMYVRGALAAYTSVKDTLELDLVARQARADEAAASANELSELGLAALWLVGGSIVFVVIGIAMILARSLVNALQQMTEAMSELSRDRLTVTVPHTGRRDELGRMAKAVEVFKAGAIERHKIQKDLQDHREHLEELVESRTLQIEQQKIQIQEALNKERELSGLQRQFVAMVSHEFRTPLAIIDGSAQGLLRRLERMTPDRLQKSLGTIRVSVGRLIELMESVLSAARLEDGQIKLETGPCALVDLINEVGGGYSELHTDRQVSMELAELPEQIIADRKLIRQVVSNLISNAVKYSPDKKGVWISGSVDDLGRAVVAVRDEGVGIPPEEQEKLFERFFRASTSTGIAGSGIGLHLASHLVQMHGGTIDLESVEGQGTTFYLRLPIAGPSATIAEETMIPSNSIDMIEVTA
ncbi:MAG: ATP-binding protein [Geminicoccales bacterium]